MSSYHRIGCSVVVHSHCRENDVTERVDDKPINPLSKGCSHAIGISLKGDKDSRIHIKGGLSLPSILSFTRSCECILPPSHGYTFIFRLELELSIS